MLNFSAMEENEIIHYIRGVKSRLGNDLIIPAHHYVVKEVVAMADLLGDSYKLAVDVSQSSAKWIVFCGVSFMAEGAAILANKNQSVISPDFSAGCPMADMIDKKQSKKAFQLISELQGKEPSPVVYMNSYADSKAFAGRYGGSVCTSSNAELIIRHYLDQNKSIFFFPDQHLGRNIANKMKLKEEEIALISSDLVLHSEPSVNVNKIKIFLWDGSCPLHQKFRNEDILKFKTRYPRSTVIVHPEVAASNCDLADVFGSTQIIYNTIKNARPRSIWGVGTEYNFIRRIAAEFPNKKILPLRQLYCDTMNQITLLKVAQSLDQLEAHILRKEDLKQVIKVDKKNAKNAAVALNQMIEIVEASKK